MNKYIVKEGESIGDVCINATGSLSNWGAIISANNFTEKVVVDKYSEINYLIDYGLLYNWYAVDTGKLAPSGWHVPSKTEFETLSTYLGGDTVAATPLKSSRFNTTEPTWTIGTVGTNIYNYNLFPNGIRQLDGRFKQKNQSFFLWSSTQFDSTMAIDRWNTFYLGSFFAEAKNIFNYGMGVRCIKDIPTEADLAKADGEYCDDVTDADGNIYRTVKIGTQVWMHSNLKTTKYNDNTSIPNVTDNSAWLALTTGAYCSYNNDTLETLGQYTESTSVLTSHQEYEVKTWTPLLTAGQEVIIPDGVALQPNVQNQIISYPAFNNFNTQIINKINDLSIIFENELLKVFEDVAEFDFEDDKQYEFES